LPLEFQVANYSPRSTNTKEDIEDIEEEEEDDWAADYFSLIV
jgi:hypothetical protein